MVSKPGFSSRSRTKRSRSPNPNPNPRGNGSGKRKGKERRLTLATPRRRRHRRRRRRPGRCSGFPSAGNRGIARDPALDSGVHAPARAGRRRHGRVATSSRRGSALAKCRQSAARERARERNELGFGARRGDDLLYSEKSAAPSDLRSDDRHRTAPGRAESGPGRDFSIPRKAAGRWARPKERPDHAPVRLFTVGRARFRPKLKEFLGFFLFLFQK